MKTKAAFLDRDCVIVRDSGYVHRIVDLELLPGVEAALARLQAAGFKLIVVTNQSGIARGIYSEQDYAAFTQALRVELALGGVHLDEVYHCPHLEDAALPMYAQSCDCRKPRPGMLLQAQREFEIDMGASLMVGDRLSDLQAGRNAGLARCYLIAETQSADMEADGVFPSLEECVARVLAEGEAQTEGSR
jgi:D-glycero-D-manno-heptose 1,7-bisphosphate phosphatase